MTDDLRKMQTMGTLRQFLEVARTGKFAINLLDGAGGGTRHFPICYAAMESDGMALDQTAGLPGIQPGKYQNDKNWALTSTPNCLSPLHMDDHGFATAVVPICGSKYWVVAKPRHTLEGEDHTMGLASAESLSLWKVYQANRDLFDLEAVLLSPGTTL